MSTTHGDHNGGHHPQPTGNQSRPASFTDPKSPWVPGLVEVVFKEDFDSGVLDPGFGNTRERQKPSDRWGSKLLEILRDNQLLGWKPSFPVTRPWSKQPQDKARDFLKKSGRDKYVTFRFAESADVAQIATDLLKVPEIKRATPVAKIVPPSISEPFLVGTGAVQVLEDGFQNQWYAFRCNLPQVLEEYTGRDVVVAAIDWGFSEFHPEYAAAIELKKNIYKNDETIDNGNYGHHGTAVLGLAAARLNGAGMVGFAPGSRLWAIQAGEDEVVNHEHWRDAIDFVRLESSPYRKVIILEIQTASGGNVEAIPSINQAIVDAIADNIVVCVPAGNRAGDAGKDDLGNDIPATGSVLVGATVFDPDHNYLQGRQGESIVVYAPGDTYRDVTCINQAINYTNRFGGTSGAVAKVGGAVALLLEANGYLAPAQVRDILKHTNIPVKTFAGVQQTAGLLDCEHAIDHALRERNR